MHENNGMPDCPNPDCPVCGAKEVERFYFYKTDLYREIIGCENCILSEAAEDY